MLALRGYADLEPIGQGGLGDVYRATQVSTGGTVAVKVLRDVTDESAAWRRVRRELAALVSLGGHAHVVQIVELLADVPGYAMEYAPGGSLAQLIERRNRTLTVAETAMAGGQAAAALAAAHAQGIVHRDVKPQNLLVDAYGQVKLCDFGIASLTHSEAFHTRTGAISMRYASPEDLEDDADVGPPADVYSLGATLLHLFHGAPPTLKQRLSPWTPPPTDEPEREALDRVLAACLQPAPAARPDAAEIRDRLEALDWSLPDRCRALTIGPGPVVIPGERPLRPRPSSMDDIGSDSDLPSETLLRSGRRRSGPPRPPVPRAHRWRSWLLGAGAAASLGAVAWSLLPDGGGPAEPSGQSPPAATASGPTSGPPGTHRAADGPARPGVGAQVGVETAPRPAALIGLDDASIDWPLGAVGDCLVQLPDDDALHPVDCDEPHDLERVATGTLPRGAGETYDGDDVDRVVDQACREAAGAYVGADLPADILIAQTRPSASSWAAGDRAYQCLLGIPGSRLVGSVAANDR